MKTILTLLMVAFAFSGFAQNANQCIKVETRWDTDFGSHNFQCRATNICNTPIDVQICLQKKDNTWTCGVNLDIEPGDKGDWYTVYVNGNGEYCTSARVAGSSVRFSPESYINENGCR